jgi:hypothetical protein
MRRARVIALFASAVLAAGGPHAGFAQGLSVGGFLQTTAELPAGADLDFSGGSFGRMDLALDLHGEAKPGENIRLYGEALFRENDLPVALTDPARLSSYATLHPLDIRLVEAYADLYDLLVPRLDLRLGKQRIAWGPAERVGVVDFLDPYDLEDPWSFGARIPSLAAKLSMSFTSLRIEAVYIPTFTPALLPADASSLMPGPAVELPGPLVLGAVTTGVEMPAGDILSNATIASRISLALGSFDVAASYLYGRQSLPAVTGITGSFAAPPSVDIAVRLQYPRQHVAGLDLAADLFGLGVWGEAAVFWPDYVVVTDMRGIGGTLAEERAAWYAKGVLGCDYTFPGGLYVNVQYSHGFFNEAAREDLNDYLLLGAEWRLPGGVVKLGPIGAAVEVDDWANIENSWALVLNPELALYPMDNAEIAAGARWIAGSDSTSFGARKEENAVYMRIRLSF